MMTFKHRIKIMLSVIIIALSLSSNAAQAQPSPKKPFFKQAVHDVVNDYRHYYSKATLIRLVVALTGGAIIANTAMDQNIQNGYQNHIRSSLTNSVAKIAKYPGNNTFVAVYAASALTGLFIRKIPLGHGLMGWGSRSLRAVAVGAPPTILLQRVLGSMRPNHGSRWRPFHQDHGVSGHAFLGSIPFLTAAYMTHNRFLRCLLYVGSTLTGLSRINDNNHYFSQAFLGWSMGYLAVRSVNETVNSNLLITPTVSSTGAGITISTAI